MLKVAILLCVLAANSLALAPIHVDLIPMSNANRPGTALSGTRYITVHNTANSNAGANAKAHANYVKNPSTQVSWHFTVDDKEIYQHLPTNEVGWHAGTTAGNTQSVGIEICENSDGNLAQAEKNAQELIAKLMGDLNVPISRVVTHQHWSGKVCPHLLIPRWSSFLAGIGGSADSCYGTVTATGGLNIRSQPDASSSIVGSFVDGAFIQLTSRTTGTPVSGNSYWFRVSQGYVAAYYIRVAAGSNHAWCRN
jgi:N-acetylmuramoyl-L-alanine amidase CwlA